MSHNVYCNNIIVVCIVYNLCLTSWDGGRNLSVDYMEQSIFWLNLNLELVPIMELIYNISELTVVTKRTPGMCFYILVRLGRGGGGVRTGEQLNQIGRKI
jgi:hypothetical protein